MEKMKDYDLTAWDTTEGFVRIRENYCGSKYYLDINNKYDKSFDTKKELEAYLKEIKAELAGYDSENDW